jgi:hypothetical protein
VINLADGDLLSAGMQSTTNPEQWGDGKALQSVSCETVAIEEFIDESFL